MTFRPRSNPLNLFIVAISAALVLAACGGGSDDSSSADEEEITSAIVTSGTTEDPSECTELETQRFVEQNQLEKGETAIAECQKAEDTSNADSIEVSNVEIDGENATAEAAVTGGGLDGQTVQISLVREDGKWKLDHLDAFKDFDKDRFVSALGESFSAGGDLTPEQASCITDALTKLDDAAIQDLFLAGDPNKLVPVLGPCVS